MIKTNMSIKYFLRDVNIKMYYIYMWISFKLNFIPYKIEKNVPMD